jgi:hypothetical protein
MFRAREIVLLLCLSVAWLGCSSGTSGWEDSVRWKDYTLSTLPSQDEFPGEGAVCLLDEGKMEIFGRGELGFSVFEQHKIVKVFDSRGERFANVVIPYGGRSEVVTIEARTISPDGTIVVLEENDIYDVSLYPNFVFFSDQRAKLFTLPAVEEGAVLEYRYRLSIFDRTFWHSWSFQHDAPTLVSRFTLVKPAEWEVNYRIYGTEIEPDVTEMPDGFKSTMHWEARDLPALRSEVGMPPSRERIARLALAPLGFNSWADVASWYHRLSWPRTEAGSETKRLVEELTAGAESDEEKLERIYTWVRDRVRYLAVEIGIGGFRPHAAEEVCMNMYGDCKDMATLVCSMAREAGLNVHQVLVSTWYNGIPDTTLPSPLHFNHAIAYAPGIGTDGIWMDPTEKGCPFGELPWYDQGIPVLVVGEEGAGEIVTTPRSRPEQNTDRTVWRVRLKEDGSASVVGRTVMRGAPAVETRKQLLYASQERRRQWLETLLAKECSGARVDSFVVEGLEPAGDSLAALYGFHTPFFVTGGGPTMMFRPGMITASELPDFFRSSERSHPVRFQYGVERELSISVALPAGWSMQPHAASDSLVSRFGSSRYRWEVNDRELLVWSHHTLAGVDVKPAQFREFREFLDSMRKQDLQDLVLTDSGRASNPDFEASP